MRIVRVPATKVNWMAFVSEGVVAPAGDIVAVPFQIPANAAGIVAPVVVGGGDGDHLVERVHSRRRRPARG